MISIETIQNLLGIKDYIPLTPEEMAKNITVTFFPFSKGSKNVELFANRLKIVIEKIGVKILPYQEALVKIEGKEKIKKGTVIISLGEGKEGNLPVDYISDLTDNPIVNILDLPKDINETSSYKEHMETGLNLFTWYMSNIAICVDDNKWIIYSFNGFSPFYKISEDFERQVLNSFIPKIATRVYPPQMNEFEIKKINYNFTDDFQLQPYLKDFTESGPLLKETGLFSPVRNIAEFQYRNNFYRRIASLHLDERKGMSYGFIARQIPLKLKKAVPFKTAKKEIKFKSKDLIIKNKKFYILIEFEKEHFVLEVPDIWVIMSRSGSEKTNLNVSKDILKIGLVNGRMIIEMSPFLQDIKDYKPSFDTRVILAHCLANTIFASLLKGVKQEAILPWIFERDGLALAHWHRNFLPEFIPRGWYVYGEEKPPVLCSSPQSAIYAFQGIEKSVKESLLSNTEYLGVIHIEPQHGININWNTIKGLASYILSHPFSLK